MGVSIFLPTRKNSQRVPEKNTRRFADFEGGLLELKLHQLVQVKGVDEIILSTNDEPSWRIGKAFQKQYPTIRLIKRPEALGTSSTLLQDLIAHAGAISLEEHILWTHVTSPLCDAGIYTRAISTYFQKLKEEFDSLFSAQRFQSFLWDEETRNIINRTGENPWPQTQDLKLLYEINNAVFLAPRTLFLNEKERVGRKPFLFEMEKISSLDIDELEDFKIAEAVYESIVK